MNKYLAFALASLTTVCLDAQELLKDGVRYELYSYLGDTTFNVIPLGESQKYEGDIIIPPTVSYNGNDYSVSGISQYSFFECENLKSITISEGLYFISDYAFSGCTKLTSVNIPNSMRFVVSNAFDDTPWFDSKPDGLVYVGNCAYKYKGDMQRDTSIVIKDGTVSISDYAFKDCENLISVEFPSSLLSIGAYSFYRCTKMATVSVPESVSSIGVEAFDGTAWYNSLPNGVYYIGSMLYGCKGDLWLDTLFVKEGTKYINRQAISTKGYLRCVIIPEGVKGIGVEAFYHCDYLDSISLPVSLEVINPYAFSECRRLKSVAIPQNVRMIGHGAFELCKNMKCITSLAVTPAICSDDAFDQINMDQCVLIVPAGSEEDYRNAPGWSSFKNIRPNVSTTAADTSSGSDVNQDSVNESDPEADSINYIIQEDGDTIYCSIQEEGYTIYYTVNEGGAYVAARAICLDGFYGRYGFDGPLTPRDPITGGLQPRSGKRSMSESIEVDSSYYTSYRGNIMIPESIMFNDSLYLVTGIKYYAFVGCKELESVNIPESVRNIGYGSFAGCSALSTVNIPSCVNEIPDALFYGCSSLGSIELPSGVHTIGHSAFHGCSGLTEITIPAGVEFIDEYAFAYCSGLKRVVIEGDPLIAETAFVGCGPDLEIIKSVVNTVETSDSDPNTDGAVHYSIEGLRISDDTPGLHIIRYRDGTVGKAVVR